MGRLGAVPKAIAKPDRVIEAFARDVDAIVVGEQAQIDPRIRLPERVEPRQQPSRSEGPDHADRDDVLIATVFKTIERFGEPAEGLDNARQQRLSFIGERDAARQPAKQLYAKPVLQHFHVLADGGLRDAKFQASTGETQVARRRFKGP